MSKGRGRTTKNCKEKAEREATEKARLLASFLYEKTKRAINLENSGSLDAALNVYYEIRSFDPQYPNAENKIQEIEKTIRFREKVEKETAEQACLKREEERQQISKKRIQSLYWSVDSIDHFEVFVSISSFKYTIPILSNQRLMIICHKLFLL